MAFWSIRLLVAVGFASAACVAGGPSETTSAGEPLDEENAAARYAGVTCALSRECGCPADGSWATCQTDVEGSFEVWQEAARVAGLVFDVDCLQRRLDNSEDNPCLGDIGLRESCLIYSGEAQLGEPCVRVGAFGAMSTCAQGLTCPWQLDVCTRPNLPALSEPLDAGEQCVDEMFAPTGTCAVSHGLFCDVDGAVPTCQSVSPVGGACRADRGCPIATSYCDAGTCAAAKGLGQACLRDGECGSWACFEGLCTDLALPNGCSSLLP